MDPRTKTSAIVAKTLVLLFALAVIAILMMKPNDSRTGGRARPQAQRRG